MQQTPTVRVRAFLEPDAVRLRAVFQFRVRAYAPRGLRFVAGIELQNRSMHKDLGDEA